MGTHPIFESDFDCLTDNMFELVTMEDNVKLEPHLFDKDMADATKQQLNRKLANRIFHKAGLCICLYDILKIGDSLILPGDGACRTFVKFRYIVFRPFLNEVIVGKVRSCTKDGLRISLDFFDDIFVPVQNIRQRNKFELENGKPKWIWYYEDEDEETSSETERFEIEIGDRIRFRVKDEYSPTRSQKWAIWRRNRPKLLFRTKL